VHGASGVLVFDSRGMQLKNGGFTGLTLHYLRKGGTIDLATRKVKP